MVDKTNFDVIDFEGSEVRFAKAAEKNAIAAAVRATRPASGFTEFGGQTGGVVSAGLWTGATQVALGNTANDGATIVDIHGRFFQIITNAALSAALINLPAINPAAHESGRQVLCFAEAWREQVTGLKNQDQSPKAGYVYPNGMVQNDANTVDGISFAANGVQSYHAYYDGDTTHGKSVEWDSLTPEQQTAFDANPYNHTEVEDGETYQWRLRLRAVAAPSAGNWDVVSPHKPKGSPYKTTIRFSSNAVDALKLQGKGDTPLGGNDLGNTGAGGAASTYDYHEFFRGGDDRTIATNGSSALSDGGTCYYMPICLVTQTHDGTTATPLAPEHVKDLRIQSREFTEADKQEWKTKATAGDLRGFGVKATMGTHQASDRDSDGYTNGVAFSAGTTVIYFSSVNPLYNKEALNPSGELILVGATGKAYKALYSSAALLKVYNADGSSVHTTISAPDFEFPNQFRVFGLESDSAPEYAASHDTTYLYGAPTWRQVVREQRLQDGVAVTNNDGRRRWYADDSDNVWYLDDGETGTYASAGETFVGGTAVSTVDRDAMGWLNDPNFADGDFVYVPVDVNDPSVSLLPRDVTYTPSLANVVGSFRVATPSSLTSGLQVLYDGRPAALLGTAEDWTSGDYYSASPVNNYVIVDSTKVADTSIVEFTVSDVAANPLTPAALGVLHTPYDRDVYMTGYNGDAKGGALFHFLSGMIAVNGGATGIDFFSTALARREFANGELSTSPTGSPITYGDLGISGNNGLHVVSAMTVVNRNGLAVIQFVFKVLLTDGTDYGDSLSILPRDYIGTETDENLQKVLTGCVEIPTNIYVGEK